jgi:carbohydrate kinase (thermoresistant glucokinase family)
MATAAAGAQADCPAFIIVMGVAGSGKTTVGKLLAERLQWQFVEGDRFHPQANIEKMRSGVALNDEDRLPWLRAIVAWMDSARSENVQAVIACSALKRSYRDILVRDRSQARFVFLKGSEETMAERLSARAHHFFPATLLRSQFEALEEPATEEAIVVSAELPPAKIVDEITGALPENCRA